MNQTAMADVYTDFSGINRLKAAAANQNESVNKEVAQQFEAMYLQMMLKTMRQSVGPGIMDSSQSEMAQGMYDQQLAIQLSKQGAIGIGDLVLRQIEGPKEETSEKPDLKFAPTYVDARPVSARQTRQGQSYQPESTAPVAENISNVIRGYQQTETASIPVSHDLYRSIQQSEESAITTPVELNQPEQHTDLGSTPQTFISRIQPAAEVAAEQLGVAPKAILAIAALETGWGKHVMRSNGGKSSNNLFGIKADVRWQKGHVMANTLEFEHGAMQRKKEPFRTYDSPAESVMDFAKFIQENPRYQTALVHSGSPDRFIEEIQKAGYATDPNYAKKVKAVMRTIENHTQDSWQVADTR